MATAARRQSCLFDVSALVLSTRRYEATHGRRPRPSQSGAWLFEITTWPAVVEFAADGPYADAARAALARAREMDADAVAVCP